jgi:flavin reductase (DIM6/NTAB) family NADH-FMN oxidoreductase RutF
MIKSPFPLAKVYGLLEPGPVLLLSTRHRGKNNVMTLSWQTMLEFEPPLIACVVSNGDFSFTALKKARQCVLNIPGSELAQQVVDCGNCSGRDTDKFAAFGLTPVDAGSVDAPLIAECFANLECRVSDTRMVNRYGLFVLEVVQAWHCTASPPPRTLHHRGYGNFMLAGETIHLPSKMR